MIRTAPILRKCAGVGNMTRDAGAAVQLEGVGLRYGAAEPVLRDISFSVAPGGFRWLLGPSGAGKSSLLRLLYLAHRPSAGQLHVLGHDITATARRDLPPLRRQIGVVFQDFRLMPHLSAFDNVALPLRLAGRPEGQIRADVEEMIRWVGLGRRSDARPAALSGGEQQRVAIARAVVGRPSTCCWRTSRPATWTTGRRTG